MSVKDGAWPHRIGLFLIVAVLAALVAGCSYLRSQQRLDLAPFAEDMIALAGDIQYGLGTQQPVYIRDHMDTPEVAEVAVYGKKLRRVIRGVIAYSIQIVHLADSDMTGKEQARELADYLDGLLRPVLEAPSPPLKLTVTDLDTILVNIKGQRKLLKALSAAQPIVDEIARVSSETFEDAKTALDAAAVSIHAGINEGSRDIIRADDMLKTYQVRVALNIEYIPRVRNGDQAAMDSLFAHMPSLREIVRAEDGISPKEIKAIEDRMLYVLRSLRELRDQLRPDLELYLNKQRELDKLLAEYNAALRKGNVAILAWSRAHDRLARGIMDPAKINLFGIAKKAAGAASPL